MSLHEGNADYVRYIDYEIGRMQGKYYQNDPALYKKNIIIIIISIRTNNLGILAQKAPS
jgi:hypothetical protein